MQPTTEILERIRKDSKEHPDEIFTRLFRYLLRPDIYYVAYQHLYANKGAGTKGVDEDTADGFSEKKIQAIIRSLSEETYTPKPVRRKYIQKRNSSKKKRPLGIPTFTDKLAQEVLRMVLEAVYEPVFLDGSHGFRPNRGCHTALKNLKKEFRGARWFVEGDIKGCFDNIDHTVLVGLVHKKIKDARVCKLIYKFLKAGYMDNWKHYTTYSGTPQGGIISPLLANIYLHELDKFVITLKREFDKPEQRGKRTPEYGKLQRQMTKLKKAIDNAEDIERQELIKKYKSTRQLLLKTPSKAQTDKVIKYIRYADDFLIGVNGNQENCRWIKAKLTEFIGGTLKMELSGEKTLITHSSQYARFLGYDICVRRSNKVKRVVKRVGKMKKSKRTLSNSTELAVPLQDKIQKFLFEKGAVKMRNGKMEPVHRPRLLGLTDLEIVATYNAELRGICNYYSLACNFNKLSYFAYLMEYYSCLKTLAAKHKSSKKKIIAHYQDEQENWGIPYETKTGMKRCYFANYADGKKAKNVSDNISNEETMYRTSVTTLEKRLKANVCELCGTTAGNFEIHHINKVKNLKGKEPWERAMIAKRRKTLVVCEACHIAIHSKK